MRDGGEHLHACVTSMKAQTLDGYEVLAIDDGSTDGSGAVLDAWARDDPRVRVLHLPPSGLVAALEAGRTLARGRYLARMDADDVAEPTRLELQSALLDGRPEVAGCGCLVRYFPDELVQGGARRYQQWINSLITPEEIERDLFVECPLAHPTFLLRAEIVDAVGGYRDEGWPEDYDLVFRLWEAGARFAKVPRVLLHWREGAGRRSRVHTAYAEDAFRQLKVHVLRRTLLARKDGAVVWGAGPTGKAFAQALIAQGERVHAFVDLDPRKIGQSIHGAPVVGPEAVNGFRGALCVAAVAQPGAREEIRQTLSALGWSERVDFVAVA